MYMRHSYHKKIFELPFKNNFMTIVSFSEKRNQNIFYDKAAFDIGDEDFKDLRKGAWKEKDRYPKLNKLDDDEKYCILY